MKIYISSFYNSAVADCFCAQSRISPRSRTIGPHRWGRNWKREECFLTFSTIVGFCLNPHQSCIGGHPAGWWWLFSSACPWDGLWLSNILVGHQNGKYLFTKSELPKTHTLHRHLSLPQISSEKPLDIGETWLAQIRNMSFPKFCFSFWVLRFYHWR